MKQHNYSIPVHWIACVLAVLCLTACQSDSEYYSPADFSRVRKVDAHTHLNTMDTTLIEQAIADNFELQTVNVDYPDFPLVADQYKVAVALAEKYPDTVRFAASFSTQGWEAPGYTDRVIDELRKARQRGAVAVKVWKNIGMEVRDGNGELLMVDDSRLDPIFSFLESEKEFPSSATRANRTTAGCRWTR